MSPGTVVTAQQKSSKWRDGIAEDATKIVVPNWEKGVSIKMNGRKSQRRLRLYYKVVWPLMMMMFLG